MKYEKDLYTVKEVTELLGLSERTVRRYIADGKLKAIKVLGNIRITKEELEKQTKGMK